MNSIKRHAKSQVSQLFSAASLRDAEAMIRDVDVVSFDVFDTLVYRLCDAPEDVFDYVEGIYQSRHSMTGEIDFRKRRIAAERAARSMSDAEEVTLSEIYEAFPRSGYAVSTEELSELEIDAELLLCRANPEAAALYRAACDAGKTIVITSDMYLPGDVIQKILSSCGYSGWSELFLSSETGFTKRSGSQFQHLLNCLSVPPSSVLHVGDHPVSDFIRPRQLGMRALQFAESKTPRCIDVLWRNRRIAGKIDAREVGLLRRLSAHECKDPDDVFEYVGGQVLGPMVVGYATWLHQLAHDEGVDEIWFLSREGRILRDAYLKLYGQDAVSNRYVCVSRLAIARGNTYSVTCIEELFSLFSVLTSGIETIGEFVSLLGLEEDERQRLFATFKAGGELESIENSSQFFETLMQIARGTFFKQNQLLLNYLRSDRGSKKVLISDIGWAGTMQALMHNNLPDYSFVGAYLAVSDFHDADASSTIDRKGQDRRGYWCGAEDWKTKGLPIRFTQTACEQLFLSTEGSVLGYESDGQAIRPVRGAVENSDSVVSAIKRMQGAAMGFVDNARRAGIGQFSRPISASSAMLPYLNFVAYPKVEALLFFEHLRFADGTKLVGFLPEHSISYYAIHPSAAVAELEKNNCKVIWFYGLLRRRLPYLGFLTLLSQIGLKSKYRRKIEHAS